MVVRAVLVLLGISLLLPGLSELFPVSIQWHGVVPEMIEAKHQFRVLHAMMAALGIVALYSCIDIVRNQLLIRVLAVVLSCVVMARFYSMFVDGVPGALTLAYLAIEVVMIVILFRWVPTKIQ
jgi:uncharacterized protein (DUF1786 family)